MRGLRPLLPAAEAALTGVTFVVVVSFWRLFETGPFLGPLLLTLLAAHGTMIVTRRLGWELWAVAPVAVVGAVLSLTWILYPATTTFLLPGRRTLDAASTDLTAAWDLFQVVRAPAPIATGFLLVAGVALWAVAFIADWAAFRVWVPFEAVIPAGTVFVFASLFSAPQKRFLAAVLFIAAVLGFVLLHRIARQQASAAWLPSHIREGVGALLGTGATLVAVAVIVAAVVAPFVPGAKSEALIDYRGGGEDGGSRVVLSPFVSIEAKLNQLANVEMFSVRSTQRSYWRLTSLDRFDGVSWTYSRPFDAASGDLPQSADPPAGGVEQAVQEFNILRLGEIFMPAAYRPVSIRDERYATRWESDSATLVIDEEFEDSDGNRYTVVSELPRLDAEVLRTADDAVSDDMAATYLALPLSFPGSVQELAEEIVLDQETQYDRALALQNYLRSDQFTYDQNIQGGGGSAAIEQFLFTTRAGFCQQFAGSFAAMARSIGLPARVAVGFTTGEERESDPGVYHVSGSHAHTWPEVYLGQFGWVPFEPTPGRGIPGGDSYTGVPESQAIPGDPTATTVRPSGVDDPFEGEVTDASAPTESPEGGGAESAAADEGFWATMRDWGERVLFVGAFVLGGLALAVGIVPIVRLLRRVRRRRQADRPGERVRVAWEESVAWAEMLGVIHRPWETPAEYARRARSAVDGGSFTELAATIGAADFSEGGASDDDAARAAELAAHIGGEARERASREQRLRAWFDPRPPERWPTARAVSRVASDDYEPVAANAPSVAVLERTDDRSRNPAR
ncbi:MAG: transglutaminaseTgpA domain-containing protein [Acidimicrobiales bacterium]